MSDAGGGGGGGAAVPTGCFKCGRPGHWSRDCPSSNPNSDNPNPNSTTSNSSYPKSNNNFSKSFGNGGGGGGGGGGSGGFVSKAAAKPKKEPRTRPKLTPELLISDEKGLGYILKYFPRNFKCRGRGHEVNDLRHLLRMYAEWHEQFLPYFPFDQFIQKVEEVGSSKRLKTCIAELKDRVANGGDPTKLKESATETETAYDKEDVSNMEEPTHDQEDLPFLGSDAGDIDRDMLNEFYNTTEEPSISRQSNNIGADGSSNENPAEHSDKSVNAGGGSSNPSQITDEQKSMMEEKRKKALERAAARSRLLPAS